jgi:hypothetical protein
VAICGVKQEGPNFLASNAKLMMGAWVSRPGDVEEHANLGKLMNTIQCMPKELEKECICEQLACGELSAQA